MKKTGIYILSLVLLHLFYTVQAQDVKIKSSFDSTKIFIGDQIKYTVTLDKPAGLNLTLPLFRDTLIKNIEILSGPVIDSSRDNGRMKIIQKYLVTSFDSGHYRVPPVYAELKNENGMKRFYSDYSQLQVMRVKIAPPDTVSKIFDIIKPYRAPVTFGDIMPWILLLIVAAALIWFAYRYIKKMRSKGKDTVVIKNPDPAHVIALREMERLRDEKLWQSGEIKLYYTRLTEILRQYLENRYRVFSLELTTSETLAALVKTGFKKNGSYNQLKDILTSADLVKFAKYNPEPAENESVFRESWEFILATKEEYVSIEEADLTDRKMEGRL